MESITENILSAITKIKVPGVATMSYWSILKTDKAIYFVQSGTALGLGVGTNNILMAASVLGDAWQSHKSKTTAKKDLSTILSESEQYFRFVPEQFNQIKIKKGLLKGKVVFPNGEKKTWTESGEVKLKLSSKKFKIFLQMFNNN